MVGIYVNITIYNHKNLDQLQFQDRYRLLAFILKFTVSHFKKKVVILITIELPSQ